MPRLGSRVRIPSPAPSTSQTLESCQKPSTRRPRPNVLPTSLLHIEAGGHGLNSRGSSKNVRRGFYTNPLHYRLVGLTLVGRNYHYRRRTPTDLLTVLGKREVWRSLETDSYKIAVRRLHQVAAMVEAQFEQARSTAGRSFDHRLLEPHLALAFQSPSSVPPSSGCSIPSESLSMSEPQAALRSISGVYGQYIADPRHTWTKRTATAHTTTRKWVEEVFGGDTPITAISREASLISKQ